MKNLVALLVLILISINTLFAQATDSLVNLSAPQYDQLVTANIWGDSSQTKMLLATLKERLKRGIYTPDETIVRVAQSASRLEFDESNKPENRSSTTYYRHQTVQYIDDIVVLLYKQDLLKAQLLRVKTYSYTKPEPAPKIDSLLMHSFAQYLPYMDSISYAVDKLRLESSYEMGNLLLYKFHDKENAEKYFIDAASYPFYKIHNYPREFYFFRSLCSQAARGIVQCNRGNLKALRLLTFMPAIWPEVFPTLRPYIIEVGGEEAWKDYLQKVGAAKIPTASELEPQK